MSKQPKQLYEFGPFRLDPSRPRLTRDGQTISLTPKALEILSVLLRHTGELVEKEELMREVWPDTFVEEGNLSVHIFALRKALGEARGGKPYIETVPRLGYRFNADVHEVGTNGSELVVERHTLSRVTIEEQETEVTTETSPANSSLPPSTNMLTLAKAVSLAAAGSRAPRWRQRRTVLVGLVLVLGFSGAVIYWLSSRRQTPTTISEVKSMAVLPFKTLNTGMEDEHLGLGLADTLITQFGRTRQLVVRPTSAVHKYAGSELDSLEVGRTLGVEAVLEGSIQRAGERLRVTVRLLRVDDGVSLWAGKFDEKFTDIFSLQDSISQQVARSLSLNLTNEEKQLLTELHTHNTEAYQEYLKGRYFWNKRTGEGLKKSLQHFNRAIDLDPTYALAYAGLADTYVLLANYGEPSMECFQKAKAAALMAIKVDQTLANPYTTLALISYRFERNWLKAESEFKRGIELSPNNATAHHWYGEYLGLAGRHAEAITELKRAQQLDPLSPIINTDLGAAFHKARQYDLAIEQLQKTVKMEPDFSLAHLFLGMCYKQKGMYEEAITELKEGVRLSGGRTIMIAVLGNIYGTAGKKGEALTTLGELAAISKRRHVPGFEMALVYIGLDEKDKAFQWLEKSYNEHDTLLAYLKVDPNLDPLRGDPRFTELLRRIGLTL